MQAKVSFQGEVREVFEVASVLGQGCILSPALFNLFFPLCSANLISPCQTLKLTYIMTWIATCSTLVLKSRSTKTARLSEFLYPGDAALGTSSQQSLQNTTTACDKTARTDGLLSVNPKLKSCTYSVKIQWTQK